MQEAARVAEPTRRNAHLSRSLLEAAINRQTERVFSLDTDGPDSLTVLKDVDFMGDGSGELPEDETGKALAELQKVVGLDGVKVRRCRLILSNPR